MSVITAKNRKPSAESRAEVTLMGILRSVYWPVAYGVLGLAIVWSMLQPLDSTEVFEGHAQPQNLVWILLALIVSLSGLLGNRSSCIGTKEWVVLAGLSLWLLPVTVNAGWHCNPRTGWHGYWHVVGLICFYYSARCLLNSAPIRGMTATILLAGAAALSLLGLHQIAVEFPQDRAQYQQDPAAVIRQMNLIAPPNSPQRLRLEARMFSPEPFATFSLANSLAVALSAALVIALGALSHSWMQSSQGPDGRLSSHSSQHGKSSPNQAKLEPKGKAERKRVSRSLVPESQLWPRLGLTVLVLLIGLVWFLTRSRIAYIALAVSAAGWILHQYRFQREIADPSEGGSDGVNDGGNKGSGSLLGFVPWAIAGLFGAAVIGAVWLWYSDRSVFSEAVRSAAFRREYWVATAEMIKDHGLLGIGLGNFQSYYPRYMLPTASETIADPHNWILDIAATCSVPFAVTVVLGIAFCLLSRPRHSENIVDGDSSVTNKSHLAPGASVQPLWLGIGALVGSIFVSLGLWLFGANLTVTLLAVAFGAILAWTAKPATDAFFTHDTFGPLWSVLTILLCLLVSGSWQAAGLAIPFLCLLCCSMASDLSVPLNRTSSVGSNGRINESAAKPAKANEAQSVFPLTVGRRRNSEWLLPIILAAVLAAFVLQSWLPVNLSSSIGMSPQGSVQSQVEAIEKARELDPLDSKWDRFRALLLTQMATDSGNRESFEQRADEAVLAIQQWAEREPVSFLTWQTSGERTLELASKASRLGLPKERFLALAGQSYRNSVDAFPTSVQLRVQLALCLFLLNDHPAALKELDRAADLDAFTTHSDRKLANQLIWIPEFEELTIDLPRSAGGWSPAEPVVNWIRSQL